MDTGAGAEEDENAAGWMAQRLRRSSAAPECPAQRQAPASGCSSCPDHAARSAPCSWSAGSPAEDRKASSNKLNT